MYVYLLDRPKRISLRPRPSSSDGLQWRMLTNITLIDGSVPIIGNHEASITGLEPAIWFKALLIDSVCVDISNAVVYWSTCSKRACTQRIMSCQPFARCNHTHECLLNEEFFLPDVDLKRGLEIATRILNEKQESQQDLLHLLHVYILPIIRLHADDKDRVQIALQRQKEVLHTLDDKLDSMTRQRGNIKEVMRQWRGDICSMLTTDSDIAGCNREFLKVLCEHLNEDIQQAYVQLDLCQQAVDLAKTKVEKKEGNHYITQLARARQARDEVHEYITKALFVIEEVTLMHDIVRRPPSVEMSDMQLGYIKINKEWEEHTKELRELQRRKVCATSVREALVNTKTDLEHTSDTLGIDLIADGRTKATDVLDSQEVLPKEWEQLQTHVNDALEQQEHLRDPHLEFCHYLQTSCTEEIEDINKHYRTRGPSVSQTTKLLVEQRLKPRSEAFRSLRASIKERKPATHFQGMTKKLLQETQEHFTKMVSLMVRDFSVPSNCSARLWTCYERCVFPEISVDIMKVYKEAYKIEMKQLRSYLPTVSITDLGLDDEWILNILGLYAPNSLTQGFGLDEPGCHRNSYDDDDDDEDNQTGIINGQSELIPEACPIRTMVETLEIYNPNPHQIKGDASKDELLPEQLKANLERFEQLRTQNLEEVDQSDFELSTRSEPPPSSLSVVRRRKKEKSGAQTWTRRGTKVLGAKWITPPPRSKSFCAPERPKSGKDEALSISLPSMLEAEKHMSSIVGPASIPIDIPGQRVSDATTAADSGVCCKSFSVSEGASYRNSTENTNNCRHKHDEGLSTNDVSIMVTPPPPESSTEEIVEEHLAKRRSDPYVAAFLERFRTAYYCFRVVLQESVPTAKFQWLCKCLKEVNDVAEKQAQLIFCGKRRMLCGDDLLTTLILFVLHGEPDEMVQAYPQLKFMEDYLPEFLDKGQFGFSVYQFLFAFQYILDKYEAMRRLNEECKSGT